MRRLVALFLLLGLAIASGPRLYVAPDDGAGYLKALIDGAQQSIDIKMYLWTRGRLDLVEAIARATRRGVRVRVLLDHDPGHGQDPLVLERLKAAGAKVKLSSPLRFLNLHEKSMLIDGQRLWFSTGNFTKSTFTRNREYAVVSDDPAWVREAERVFNADWAEKPISLKDARLIWSPERVLGFLHPVFEGNARSRLLALIARAKKEIWIEQNGFTDEEIYRALRAALERGVRVRLLGTKPRPGDTYFAPLAERLARAGAELRYATHLKIHAKAMLIDGKLAFVGSQNFTPTALEANRELGGVLEDARLLARLKATFAYDWSRATAALAPAPTRPIPWQEAGKYLGQLVVVEGRVLGVEERRGLFKLYFDPGQSFVVVVPKDAPIPVRDLVGRRVRVTGRVSEYRGRPEIWVKSPYQLEVVR